MKFNTKLFLILTAIILVVTFISCMSLFAVEEGQDYVIARILSLPFYVLRFPTLVLWPGYFFDGNNFYLGILLNSVFYAFVLERLISFYRKPS